MLDERRVASNTAVTCNALRRVLRHVIFRLLYMRGLTGRFKQLASTLCKGQKECPFCHKLHPITKGGYTKHIRSCEKKHKQALEDERIQNEMHQRKLYR
jgi:hypothetical protein